MEIKKVTYKHTQQFGVAYYLREDSGFLYPTYQAAKVQHQALDGGYKYVGNLMWFNGVYNLVPYPETKPSPEPQKAPPIGLRPTSMAWEQFDQARCKEIGEAVLRYAEALVPIPPEWLDELNELIQRNQPENKEQACVHTTLN